MKPKAPDIRVYSRHPSVAKLARDLAADYSASVEVLSVDGLILTGSNGEPLAVRLRRPKPLRQTDSDDIAF